MFGSFFWGLLLPLLAVALVLLGVFDRFAFADLRRRHHDHLLPGTPRSPR